VMIMALLVLAGLAVVGGATWSVLNGPVARDPRRNATTSGLLLCASAIAVLAGVGYAVAGWWF